MESRHTPPVRGDRRSNHASSQGILERMLMLSRAHYLLLLVNAGLMLLSGYLLWGMPGLGIGLLVWALLSITYLSSHPEPEALDPPAPIEAPRASGPELRPHASSEPVPEPAGNQSKLAETRLLLVSQDTSDRHDIRKNLRSWGGQVTRVPSAVRAFHELVKSVELGQPFHAAIVDQGRLDMDSSQFAASIRSEPQLQVLSLILVGSLRKVQASEQLKNAGYTSLLATPLDKTLLYNAVHGAARIPFDNGQVVRLIDHYTSRSTQPPLSILLAETELGEKHRIRMALQRMGHQVFQVDDGARVLAALDSHRFDLTISNMKLRQVTGLEVFKLYRFSRIDQPWIPFILLLDESNPQTIQACKDAGVDCVLSKPIETRELLRAVNDVVNKCFHDQFTQQTSIPSTHSPRRSNVIVIEGITLDSRRLQELEQLGRDSGFLSDLIQNFLEETNELLIRMRSAVLENDINRFYNLGHALKDSAGSLGVVDLYRISSRAMRFDPNRFPDDAFKLVEELEQCCQRSHAALRHFLDQSGSIHRLE